MSTVTSLGFNITAKWDGAGLRDAQAQLDTLKKALNAIDGQNLRITVDVDDSAALSKLESLQAMVTNQSMTVNVNADTVAATTKLTALSDQLGHIASTHATATADVNASSAALDPVQARLSAFGTSHATATADVNAQAGALDAVRARLDQFGTMHDTAIADVNAQSAALDSLKAKVVNFGTMHETATASVNVNSGNLTEVETRLHAFGAMHETATADVNVDRAHTAFGVLVRDSGSAVQGLGGVASAAGGAGQALGGVGGAAGGASSGMQQAGQSGQAGGAGVGALGTAAVWTAVALAAIGPAAALASAAVIGTLGTAFVGMGALALAQTKVVQNAFTGLKNSVMADALQAAQGMKGPLLDGIKELETGLHALLPAFTQAFSASATLIKPLVDSLLGFTSQIMPGVIDALRAAGPVFQGLRDGMTSLGSGMSTMFSGMAAGAKGAGSALNTALSGVGKILGTLGVAFGQMAAAGARSFAGLMSGINSLVSGAMAGFVKAVKLMDGTLGPFLATLGKLVGTVLQSLLPVFAQLMVAIMSGLTPVMKAIQPVISSVGSALLSIAKAITPLMAVLGQLAAHLISALAPAFSMMLKEVVAVATSLIGALVPAIKILAPIFVQIATTLAAAFVPALKAMGAAFVSLAPSLTKIVVMLAQIVAQVLPPLLPALVQIIQAWIKWDLALVPLMPLILKLVTMLVQLAVAVLPVLIPVLTLIANVFATVLTAAVKIFVIAIDAVVTALKNLPAVWAVVSAALVTAWNATWNGMKVAGEAIWTAIQVSWKNTVTALATVWTVTSAALTTAWNAVWNAMKVAAEAIWVALQTAWTNTCNAFSTAMSTVLNAMSSAWSAAWNAIKVAGEAIWVALQTSWHNTVTALSNFMTDSLAFMKNAWSVAWDAIKAAGEAIWVALQTAWHNTVTTLSNYTTDSMNFIKNAWSAGWNALKAAAEAVWTALQSAYHNTVTAISNFTTSFMSFMKNAWAQGAKDIGAAWNTIKKLIRDPIQAVVDIVYNNGIVKLWNIVAGAFGAKPLGAFTLKNFAEGGQVSGPGTGTSDSIPARLSNGEHVITAAEVQGAGGHQAVAAQRMKWANGAGVRTMGDAGMNYALGGGIHIPGTNINVDPGGLAKSAFDVVAGFGGDVMKKIAGLALGEISGPVNALIQKAADAGKDAVKKIIPGTPMTEDLIAGGPGGVVSSGGANPQDSAASGSKAQGAVDTHGGGMIQTIADTIKSWISSHDIPVGGGNTADAQKWADAQVGKPYSLGSFGSSFDCSSFMSGIASIILGKKPGPLFTTFAFTGAAKGPATFEKNRKSPFQVGVENRGVGHMAGTLNGKNYEATPPKVRSGPSARGAHDPMFSMVYGMKASEGGGVIPTGEHKTIIDEALKAAGVPPPGSLAQWEAGLNTLITRESGWNSGAVNKTDSNAAAGHASQGLAQVIPSTFAANHVAGTSSNILDPVANIAAAIRYIVRTYGNISNVQQADASKPPKGYATGTTNATPGAHLVGEQGPELVLFGGGETVKNASDTSSILGSSPAAKTTTDPAANPTGTAVDLPAQKLAQNSAMWKTYMTTIRTTSDTAWKGVRATADTNWSSMQASVIPFASTMAKAIADSGSSIVDSSKSTWNSTRNMAIGTWSDQKNEGASFNSSLQKSFFDTGTAIQSKWKTDWSDNKSLTDKTWSDEKAGAATFGADLKKVYTDTSTTLQTTWKNSLTQSTADTAKYWTDTKAAYTTGTSDIQTGFINPVTTMMDTTLPAAFNASVTAIGTGWTNLKTTVRDPVAAVVDVVFNQGIVAMWNAIAKTFDAPTLDTFTMPGFATGGEVKGAGTGTSDSITAKLSHGEHVWTSAEVKAAGGHSSVAGMRSAVMGGAGVRTMGTNKFATGGGVSAGGGTQGGTTSATAATPTGGDAITAAAAAALGSISAISNPFIDAAAAAGKTAIAALLPDTSPYKTAMNNMVDQMDTKVTDWIKTNDVAPTFGGGSDVAAQAWADSQVGKPYVLGGDFVNGIDCSEYQSGIARAILGQTPAPWFTTFAFEGDTAPAGFQQGLEAPYMVGITNVGVGHMAGTLNGTNYEATPPAVRSGPSARGYNDSMFTNQYGFAPSIQAAVASVSDSNHLAIIDAALAAASVPPPGTLADWEDGLNTIITYESAWDPNAINNTDINAQNGVPSQGLAQVIPPTFAAYHVAGTSSSILDPIANVAAAINYIVSVYGNIDNVPGVASIRAGGGYLPYYGGTRGAQNGWHTVGERGPEWVKFRGGEEVLPNGQLPPSNGGGGGGDVTVSCPITVQGNMDSDAYKRVENELVPKIRMMLQQRRGK